MTFTILPALVSVMFAAFSPAAAPRSEAIAHAISSTHTANRPWLLAKAVRRTAPKYLTAAQAQEHVAAALAAETSTISAEFLLGWAYVESRYNSLSVSRVVAGKRKTGVWRGTGPAGKGPRFCGVLQTVAKRSWATCVAQRDLKIGYATAVAELTRWRQACRGAKYRRVKNCDLLGYGGGYAAIERNRVRAHSKYPAKVLRRAARVTREVERLRRAARRPAS